MKAYRFITKPLRGMGMEKHLLLIKLHNHFVKRLSSEYIDVNGYKMVAGHEDWLHFQYYDSYEPMTTKIISKLIKDGDVVVDVGANIGYYTLLFSRLVGKNGVVYAFEPGPTNFEFLEKNIELNGYKNIVAEKKAVSDTAGIIKLYMHETNPGGHTIKNAYENLKSIDVESITLQNYFSDKKICFIKVDVEGAEDLVLKGAGRIIDGNVGIVMEFNTDIMLANNTDFRKLFKDLSIKGYVFTGINEKERSILKMNEGDINALNITHKGKTLNVLCLKDMALRKQ